MVTGESGGTPGLAFLMVNVGSGAARLPCGPAQARVLSGRGLYCVGGCLRPLRATGDRGVFSPRPERGGRAEGEPVSIEAALDARAECSLYEDGEPREQCYIGYGLDQGGVEAYLDTVRAMESSLLPSPEDKDAAVGRRLQMAGRVVDVVAFLCMLPVWVVGASVLLVISTSVQMMHSGYHAARHGSGHQQRILQQWTEQLQQGHGIDHTVAGDTIEMDEWEVAPEVARAVLERCWGRDSAVAVLEKCWVAPASDAPHETLSGGGSSGANACDQ